MAEEPDTRPRKGDSTPDSQRARYEARGSQKSTADYMDEEYEAGRRAGASESSTSTPSPKQPKLTGGGHLAVGAPLLVETALISINSFNVDRRPPLPSQLLVAFAFFGLLGLASGDAAAPAAALGWGIVLATFYSKSGAKGTPPAIGALNTIGNFFGGEYATPGSKPSTAGQESTTVAGGSEAGAMSLQ